MSTVRIVRTPDELRNALGETTPGLVPTMGALHEGHISLIRRSVAENPATVVSVFVNPTQFERPGDLDAYPRDLDVDAARTDSAGADLIYAPDISTVYPAGFATTVFLTGPAERWEGESRPGHFAGVATVVTILLNTVRPARTYFGEKDFQQLAVIRRLHADLRLPGEIIGCPTVRDRDGLALSSRNSRLSAAERAAAAAIPDALFVIRDRVESGEIETRELLPAGRAVIAAEPLLTLDYLAIVDGKSLDPVEKVYPGTRILIAATAGSTRLIDNIGIP